MRGTGGVYSENNRKSHEVVRILTESDSHLHWEKSPIRRKTCPRRLVRRARGGTAGGKERCGIRPFFPSKNVDSQGIVTIKKMWKVVKKRDLSH